MNMKEIQKFQKRIPTSSVAMIKVGGHRTDYYMNA